MGQVKGYKRQQRASESATDKHYESVLEWANKSRTVAKIASVGSIIFLVTAVGDAILEKNPENSLRGSAVALIAAGIAAGIAALNSRSSGKAAEQINVAYGRQHQMDMFKRTKDLYWTTRLSKVAETGHAICEKETELAKDRFAKAVEPVNAMEPVKAIDAYLAMVAGEAEPARALRVRVAELVKAADGSHALSLHAKEAELAKDRFAEAAELAKAADGSHAQLVSEWLESIKAIATQPVEGPGTGRR